MKMKFSTKDLIDPWKYAEIWNLYQLRMEMKFSTKDWLTHESILKYEIYIKSEWKWKFAQKIVKE